MLRAVLLLAFWGVAAPFVGLIGFPWTFLTGKVDVLYRIAMRVARAGVRLVGIEVEVQGREQLDSATTYIFMCNHVSNIDPPIVVPLIPGRTSVLAKKELFRVPLLGRAMRMASLVPVDRKNREAAIASLRAAVDVVRAGVSMTIFPEGMRSSDGRLLPFKKGPFYLAMEAGVPIVPMTIVGTHWVWPKGKFAVRPGKVTVIFHAPLDSRAFADREVLLTAVWEAVRSGLPPEIRD